MHRRVQKVPQQGIEPWFLVLKVQRPALNDWGYLITSGLCLIYSVVYCFFKFISLN